MTNNPLMELTTPMTNSEQQAGYHVWTVGDRLRAARETVTADRTQFAEMIGVSPDTVRNYERGIFKPKPIVLNAWCLATGFNREWIETGHLPTDPHDGATTESDDGSENYLFTDRDLVAA